MTEPQAENRHQETEVVVDHGKLKGCHGRVLIALLVLIALFLALAVMIARGMLTRTPPPPRRAAADALVCDLACRDSAEIRLDA